MLEIKSNLYNKNLLENYQKKLKELENSDYPLKKVIDTIYESEIVEKEIQCE